MDSAETPKRKGDLADSPVVLVVPGTQFSETRGGFSVFARVCPAGPGPGPALRVGMVILDFDTQHTNNIPMDSPEHGDHHDTLGMHRARSKHELPTSEGMTFFSSTEGSRQRTPHKADSRRGEVARWRSRARSNGNQSHLHAQRAYSCARLDLIADDVQSAIPGLATERGSGGGASGHSMARRQARRPSRGASEPQDHRARTCTLQTMPEARSWTRAK